MGHEDEDIIILSVTLPGGCVTPLDNLVAAGSYGSSREDVALHFICRALGVDPRPQLPDALPHVEATQEAETEAAGPAVADEAGSGEDVQSERGPVEDAK